MKTLIATFLFLFALGSVTSAQDFDLTQLQKIGPVTGFVKTEKGITLNCTDNSQVQLTVLAPDLIRVRAAFGKPIPVKDHSWAIAKESWDITPWTINETADAITVSTTEIEAVVRRSPLLIEFRDARTHQA